MESLLLNAFHFERELHLFRSRPEVHRNAEVGQRDLGRAREALALAAPRILAATDALSVDDDVLRHAAQRSACR